MVSTINFIRRESDFFNDRTYRTIVSTCILDRRRASELHAILRDNHVNQKLRDAEALIEAVMEAPDERLPRQLNWTFKTTNFWKAVFPDPKFAKPKK